MPSHGLLVPGQLSQGPTLDTVIVWMRRSVRPSSLLPPSTSTHHFLFQIFTMSPDEHFVSHCTALHRDLRLEDNPALYMACLVARQVIPLFAWCPEEEGQFQPGKQSRWWLHHSLKSLQQDFLKMNSKLIIRTGNSSFDVLQEVVKVRVR